MRVPYKFSVDGGDAESFDIFISWTVSNSNDVGLWADMGVRLVHSQGVVSWHTSSEDEVMCMFVPGLGMVIDYAQDRFPVGMEPDMGFIVRNVFGIVMGSFDKPVRYNKPKTDHKVDPNVYSTFIGRPMLVPPKSSVPFNTTLTIPGPAASEGMADFWDQFGSFWGGKGSPEFHVEASIVELAHYYADQPHHEESGELVKKQRVNNALELRLGSEADTEWLERQEWDVDIGI
tara:strand:- start:666 stop:1361 length:696 start_codon:yes stop_codon:yes gene_type:complete